MQPSIFSLSFDPSTTQDFVMRNVESILVRLVARGCEGTKVEVIENPAPDIITGLTGYVLESISAVTLYLRERDALYLKDARVIAAKGKWFLQSSSITSRCGCGSSFSFDDKVAAFLSTSEAFAES